MNFKSDLLSIILFVVGCISLSACCFTGQKPAIIPGIVGIFFALMGAIGIGLEIAKLKP